MKKILAVSFLLLLYYSGPIFSAEKMQSSCSGLPDHASLTEALKKSTGVGDPKVNGGLALNMWATIVGRDGTVCSVTYTGVKWDDQWPGSRAISAQKANTANAFSLAGLAISTANLFSAVQPGGSLYGLQFSNPVDPAVVYAGAASNYGKPNDPMVGKKIGGVNVFGGGLALYNEQGQIVGAVGVSGDTACADHNIAWKTRKALGLDKVPAGVNASKGGKGTDNIIYDIMDGKSKGGFGHPDCGMGEKAISEGF